MDPEIIIDRAALLHMVYDTWFDLEDLAFDREQREARLYLSDGRKGAHDEKLLRITDVSDVSPDDPARTGRYCLDDIEITASSVRLATSAGLEIDLAVGERCRIHIVHEPRAADASSGRYPAC